MNQKLIYGVLILASVIGFISVPALGAVCVVCNSADDENCLRSPSGMTGTPCADHTCFTRIEDGHVVRGCAVTLPADVRANCTGEISYCETCVQISTLPGIPCNNKVFPERRLSCHQCQGHLNGPCGQVPITNPTLCRLFSHNDRCFTRRDGDHITRDCESSNICSDGKCSFCLTEGCNVHIGTDIDNNYAGSAMRQNHNIIFSFATIFSVFALKFFF